jgi:hypothetical protein
MAITAVGTLASAANPGQTTLAVSPTTLGNALVLVIHTASNTVFPTGVTGGGCTWVAAGTNFLDSGIFGSPQNHQ